MPPISPPPPTGTSTVSRALSISGPISGACAASSRATVPWPSRVSRWSKACTLIAPELCTQACAAASASAYRSPVTISSAPSCRMRSILAGADTVGTKILAGTLRRCAA